MSFDANIDMIKSISLRKEIIERCEKAIQHHKEEK